MNETAPDRKTAMPQSPLSSRGLWRYINGADASSPGPKTELPMLYVFDCDGVLVDSETIASSVESASLAEFGYEITPQEINHRFAGLTARAIGDVVEAETGRKLPDDFFERNQAEIDRRLANELEAVAGVHEMLDRLEGQKRCVCSNSSTKRLRISLERTRLWDRFAPHIYSAVEVGDFQPKPAPNVYRYAMAKFGVDPRDTVVLEDSAVRCHGGQGGRRPCRRLYRRRSYLAHPCRHADRCRRGNGDQSAHQPAGDGGCPARLGRNAGLTMKYCGKSAQPPEFAADKNSFHVAAVLAGTWSRSVRARFPRRPPS